jgi:peptidoglycan hydrolase CwlO-like protein
LKKIALAVFTALLITACGETKTRQEINRRKAALVEKQETELKKAQAELWKTDSLLQLTNQKFDSLTKEVEAHKQALKATPEELTALTQLRIKRDSIRTQYEALGLKIRYIHKKQKEK